MIYHDSTNISTSPFIELNNFLNWIFLKFFELNNFLNWIFVKNIELDNLLNWIFVKYYWIEYWIESFFGKIQILNWINLGIAHPYLDEATSALDSESEKVMIWKTRMSDKQALSWSEGVKRLSLIIKVSPSLLSF